jgi:hypothetical protein
LSETRQPVLRRGVRAAFVEDKPIQEQQITTPQRWVDHVKASDIRDAGTGDFVEAAVGGQPVGEAVRAGLEEQGAGRGIVIDQRDCAGRGVKRKIWWWAMVGVGRKRVCESGPRRGRAPTSWVGEGVLMTNLQSRKEPIGRFGR